MSEPEQDKKLTFEEAMAQLERIVSEIESGEVPLEVSVERYAAGIKLVKQCRSILDGAEKKIQLLAENADGELASAGELDEPEPDEQE